MRCVCVERTAQTCNVIGPSRGKHKECGCQGAVLNLPASERRSPDQILLLAVCRAVVYKKYGMSRVLCGVDTDGTEHDELNYASDMRALDEGRWITIPDDLNGGTRRVRLRLWQIVVGADMLAASSVGPFQDGPNANMFCRGCYVNQSKPGAFAPTSFHRTQRTANLPPVPATRTWPQLKAVLDQCRSPSISAAERKRLMTAAGIVRLYFAMDPKYIPHVDPTCDMIVDGLHLFGAGLLRSEGAWLFYVLIKLGFDIAIVNRAMRSYQYWPRDVRIPALLPSLKEGAVGGKPKSDKTLRMTSAEAMHFALHRYPRHPASPACLPTALGLICLACAVGAPVCRC